ncbi:MAG: 7TM diverse intracellular signaling domain-containing protein [Ferruginibacter sp.]
MMDFNKYLIFFFESISLFMGMFFLMQYFILQKKEHLFYSLYLFAISAYYPLAIPDLFFGASLEDTKAIARFDLFKRPIQFSVSLCYTCFIMYYLGVKHNSYKLYRQFRVLNYMYAFLSLGCLALNYFNIKYDTAYFFISIALFPVQVYVLITLFREKVKYSPFIIWGSIIVVMGSSVSLIDSVWLIKPTTNLSQANASSYLPVQIAILIDIFLFTIALQKKIADNEKSLINAAYQRQQAIVLERERIIADLHDDVGGGLSSIRMMSDLMAQQTASTNPLHTYSFAQKISVTAKDIAQRMHTIIWSLNAENDTLNNFAEYVRQYGISFFEDSPIAFECNNLSGLPAAIELSGVQRKNLFLIVKEAFHNILKHSNANKASITIAMQKHLLVIEVTDNGKGITNENKFGNGLKNMKKRMDEINGELQFSSHNGTTIKFFVRLQ